MIEGNREPEDHESTRSSKSFELANQAMPLTIGDVAELFGIPASTIRFWERQGLLSFERTESGGYRQFTFQDLVDIAEIIFARNLDMPLSEAKTLHERSPEDLGQTFDELEATMTERVVQLSKTLKAIHIRRMPLKTWAVLKELPLTRRKVALPAVYEFDFASADMVKTYLDDPSQAIDIISADPAEPLRYGRFMQESSWGLIREADAEERTYLYGGLLMDAQRKTNVQDFWDEAKALGFGYGDTICRYLFAAEHEELGYCYYFEAWLELFE